MRVTINQPVPFGPTYLFNRILSSDLNINMGSAQYVRRTNHSFYEIVLNDSVHRLIIPVKHVGKQELELNECEMDMSHNWVRKHLATIKMAYGKAPFFSEVFPIVEANLGRGSSLGESAFFSMSDVFSYLNAKTNTTNDYTLAPKLLERPSDWILSLCLAAGATEYFCGEWALKNYLRVEYFTEKGIAVTHQNWSPKAGIKPCLSILDALFRYGRGALEYIQS